ncbi:phenylacetate--CoA ligase family protein [Bacillus cereus group sp. BfR-BA-01383]|uniref:phenylacetate--CoA ligase family protein n=1 Tax=Bacillus cereus group sp. BfR-BA-01383 TaxID=2920327 RepID=UPI001F59C669|nr:AMP-binding protein [Bacillus cereus group sp. BfR-BA-01383]
MSTISPLSWKADTGRIRLAENLDTMSREEIEHLQEHNLIAMVEAAKSSPTVVEHFPGLTLVANARQIKQLPLMSPDNLATLCPPHSDKLLMDGQGFGMVLRSSGTSGRAKVVYHSWSFNRQVSLLGARGVRNALLKSPLKLVNCMQPGELNGSFMFCQDICQLLPALVLPVGSAIHKDELIKLIIEHEVDTIVGSPAFVVNLITNSSLIEASCLSNFLYIGEAIGTKRKRALQAVAPNLKVRSLAYSSNETGPIGYQCLHVDDSTHHIHEDAVLVEIVDEKTGLPVPNGTVGEVVVTPLTDSGMALFRYRIGDRGYLHNERCACGSAVRLLTLEGRAGQSINIDTMTISGDLLMNLLGSLGVNNATDCQFQVLWNDNSVNFEIKLLLCLNIPKEITTEAVVEVFKTSYHMNRILNNPYLTSFQVERVELEHFAQSSRGKVPLFYQNIQNRGNLYDI